MNALARSITRFIDLFYTGPIRRLVSRQMFRYAFCGCANMALDAVLYFLIYHFIVRYRYLDLGLAVMSPHIQALFLVFPITFFNGFWLNRNVAFRDSPLRGSTQLGRYALSVAGSFLLNYACMKVFVELLLVYPTPSKLLTTAVSVVYSYVMQKYFTFRGAVSE